MLSFYLKDVAEIISGKFYGSDAIMFDRIITDSRNVGNLKSDLFIAIVGLQHDGHNFLDELYAKGVRAFIISKEIDYANFSEAAFVMVENSISALHKLVAYKRHLFDIPVIGITGSNGKTIVKEWLSWILDDYFRITRNPKSYNSQIGVPLSLWLLNSETELGIFEAGISMPGEMERLEKILSPTIGIITNIGPAHQANFETVEQKTIEKLKLFNNTQIVIYNVDNDIVSRNLKSNKNIKQHITWSGKNNGIVNVKQIEYSENHSIITLEHESEEQKIKIPYIDKGSIQNAITCFCTLLALKIEITPNIIKRFSQLPNIEMRLEMLNGINNSIIINDSYNSDINSLEIALDYLNRKKTNRKTTVIMSDILENSVNITDLYSSISNLIKEKKIHKFIGIGELLVKNKNLFPEGSLFYTDTDNFLSDINNIDFSDSAILIKGARYFRFEQISNKLQAKKHETLIEIDLNLVKKNLDYFKSKINPNTKIMAMVKAFSYGNGYLEIASLLEHNRIDYLAVAFADEGVDLREGGIKTPIMVMNTNLASVQTMIEYMLEPEIYSINILKNLIIELESKNIRDFPIHIKVDTGMHRLGLTEFDIEEFCRIINKTNSVSIKSVFSHLAGSEDQGLDYFTKQQVELFLSIYKKISQAANSLPDRHILNSNGIIRFPEYDFEMVRLGIGLYGLIPELEDNISQVSTFKSIVSQIHNVKKGESISYNRSGRVNKNSVIATIPVGYADGIDRRLGNGNWYFMINSKKAYTIGNICMDMCMIDITGIEAKEGDNVIVFGNDNSVCKMAEILATIPYEIITGISQRVKRVYFEE
jgi:alanine racemase